VAVLQDGTPAFFPKALSPEQGLLLCDSVAEAVSRFSAHRVFPDSAARFLSNKLRKGSLIVAHMQKICAISR